MSDLQPAYGDVRALFAATYPRLVRALTLAGGSQPDTEELVQDAFVRLLPRWDRVRAYDDPEGWVRSVAFRELGKRRRRLDNAVRATQRLGVPPDQAPPSGEVLDVAAALATRVASTPGEGTRVPLAKHSACACALSSPPCPSQRPPSSWSPPTRRPRRT